MYLKNIRKEVMLTLEKNIDQFVYKFLIPAEKNLATNWFFTQFSKRQFYYWSIRN